jgi:hypothetical protein
VEREGDEATAADRYIVDNQLNTFGERKEKKKEWAVTIHWEVEVNKAPRSSRKLE